MKKIDQNTYIKRYNFQKFYILRITLIVNIYIHSNIHLNDITMREIRCDLKVIL